MSKRKSPHQCKIPSCERDAEIRDLCKRCYSSLYYWSKKTPTQIMDRQENLRLYDSRLSMFTNVRSIGAGKSKKTRAA